VRFVLAWEGVVFLVHPHVTYIRCHRSHERADG